jgi:hypothetical protein
LYVRRWAYEKNNIVQEIIKLSFFIRSHRIAHYLVFIIAERKQACGYALIAPDSCKSSEIYPGRALSGTGAGWFVSPVKKCYWKSMAEE